MKKIIEQNGKHYEVELCNSGWVDSAVCIETGEVYTTEKHNERYGYDNKLRCNRRYNCLASIDNPNRRLDIAKDELF